MLQIEGFMDTIIKHLVFFTTLEGVEKTFFLKLWLVLHIWPRQKGTENGIVINVTIYMPLLLEIQ